MRARIYGGGPAFPVPGKVAHYDEGTFEDAPFAGMTLRDYFAGKAMQGLMARIGAHEAHLVAHDAYSVADAMLDERDGS